MFSITSLDRKRSFLDLNKRGIVKTFGTPTLYQNIVNDYNQPSLILQLFKIIFCSYAINLRGIKNNHPPCPENVKSNTIF